MLRKDVKLGFAIGGIMLAVLVVYVLVVPGTDRHPVGIVTDDTQPKAPDKSAGDKSAGDNTVAIVDSKANELKSGDVKPLDNTRANDKPAEKADNKSPDQTNATGDKPVDTARVDNSNGTASAVKNNAGGNDGGIWESALNDGKLPPTMMSTTPPLENKAKAFVPATVADKHPAHDPAADNLAKAPVDTASADNKPSNDSTANDKATNAYTAEPGSSDKSVDNSSGGNDRTHVIQSGETLTSIAAAVYNDGRQWKRIAAANPKVNPNRLKVGTKLVIPPAATAAAASADSATLASATSGPHASAAAAPIDPQTQYRVEANDNLYRISMKLYGRADQLDKIYELNKDAIGPDKGRLKLHMVLKLPQPPTSTLSNTASR